MQGIINSGMGAAKGARPETPKPPEPPRPPQGSQQRRGNQQPQPNQSQGGNGVDMSPERAMKQRNVLVNSMLKSLYGPMLDNAGEILRRSADDPIDGIGRIVGSLMSASYKSLQEQGRTITPGVMVQAGMIASQAVGEMAGRIGAITPENEADIVESGFMVGMQRFGQNNADTLTTDQKQRYAELIDSLEEGKQMAMQGSSPERNGQMPGGQPAMQRGGNPGMMARGGA